MTKKILKVYDNLLKAVLVAIIVAFIVIVFAQVISRYVFNNSLSWSEELARVLFTQMIFLAAPLVVLEKKAIAVDIVVQFLPLGAKRYLYLVIHMLSFVFFCFLGVSGWNFAMANLNQRTTALSLNIGYLYCVIPVASLMMGINCIRAGIDDYCNTYRPQKGGKEA